MFSVCVCVSMCLCVWNSMWGEGTVLFLNIFLVSCSSVVASLFPNAPGIYTSLYVYVSTSISIYHSISMCTCELSLNVLLCLSVYVDTPKIFYLSTLLYLYVYTYLFVYMWTIPQHIFGVMPVCGGLALSQRIKYLSVSIISIRVSLCVHNTKYLSVSIIQIYISLCL